MPVPRFAPAMKGRQRSHLPLLTLGGLGPRESRQDKGVLMLLVVMGRGGGPSHHLAEAFPKQTLVINGDVLSEGGMALTVGVCPDSQGLHSENMEAGMHSPGPNVGHRNRGMFDAGVCKGRCPSVLPRFLKGLSGLAQAPGQSMRCIGMLRQHYRFYRKFY